MSRVGQLSNLTQTEIDCIETKLTLLDTTLDQKSEKVIQDVTSEVIQLSSLQQPLSLTVSSLRDTLNQTMNLTEVSMAFTAVDPTVATTHLSVCQNERKAFEIFQRRKFL